ncbi:exo-beta-1,3-glucanase [Punctularia strigosozonata HHB-11173 SS5]|uniref:Exo-beta-1,3-glucanase n=1 Tax=Punctularia strigosozonata (strain HHB-11173) TaxID=741275 RepID=R7S1K1_PUNST|nr:exo-beta-1,3-glucanase [Punctularia strigosozonata HHB-11173 SS5]EIN04108.1 exo-beta-1,3-glucanase [Punctularia strigosozonata HHB-11173 SS5]
MSPFWMESIPHRGKAPFHADSNQYQVFRNVKDFGAKGDGLTDDTSAINSAISSGGRCGGGRCGSSTISPAVVYFPKGVYLVSAPIIAYYYTQIIGDARLPPTIMASSNFAGIAVIDADPYMEGGANWYQNQNNFFRSVRNLVIDLKRMHARTTATGLHWQVSQATSLINITVNMSTEPGNNHQGIFMENGSGGFMGDLVFNGGKYGVWLGNQQFTVRNITVNNAESAIYLHWNWGWTFQNVKINNCQVGFDLNTGGTTPENQATLAVIDASATDTRMFLRTSQGSHESLAGSVVLSNITLTRVPVAVHVSGGPDLLPGTEKTKIIDSWAQGNVYTGSQASPAFTQGPLSSRPKPRALLNDKGQIYGKGHPQYEGHGVDDFISVKAEGARGDGQTDDTAAIQKILNQFAATKIVFFDHGVYVVSSTIFIPPNARIVGEAWSVIMGVGPNFERESHPRVVVKVGQMGDTGLVEITDVIFATRGSTPGAIIVEWNVHDATTSRGGMWDTHIRRGSFCLEAAQCSSDKADANVYAAFLGLHLTRDSTAYLEGTWVWLADHDLDYGEGSTQITLFSGRGILSESQGPVWMIGTEHHVLYQYSLVGAKDHYMGLIQTETPYYQPLPAPPAPCSLHAEYHDPPANSFTHQAAWGLWVRKSSGIIVFGRPHYPSFCLFNYTQACIADKSCQSHIANVDEGSDIEIYSLSTVGTMWMLSVEGEGIINWSKNRNGFAETATAWAKSWSS